MYYRLFLLLAIIIVIVFLIFCVIRRLKKNILKNIAELQEFFGEISKILDEDDEMREVISDNFDFVVTEVSEKMSFLDILQINNNLVTQKTKLLKQMKMTQLSNIYPKNLKIFYSMCRNCMKCRGEGMGTSNCETCYPLLSHQSWSAISHKVLCCCRVELQ